MDPFSAWVKRHRRQCPVLWGGYGSDTYHPYYTVTVIGSSDPLRIGLSFDLVPRDTHPDRGTLEAKGTAPGDSRLYVLAHHGSR